MEEIGKQSYHLLTQMTSGRRRRRPRVHGSGGPLGMRPICRVHWFFSLLTLQLCVVYLSPVF